MSMISNLVKELREYGSQRKGEISSLTLIAAETIELLSEKARGQEWISCSERLPSENGKTYLTCLGDSGYEWYQTLTYYDGWNCTKQDRESEIKGVVAWMPIEPWEGADDD